MWFKVDDKFHDHRKVRDPDLAAVGLWTLSGSWAGENLTDGFIPESVARRWATPARLRKLAGWLVERGLWEEAGRGRESGWLYHDWQDYNPLEDEQTSDLSRIRWRRKNELSKNKPLREKVVTRDRGMCRYCGARVNWQDRRGPQGGTYDHVDPDGPNSLENLVVACRQCNGIKRDRTPDEAMMPLLPVPIAYSEQPPEPSPSQVRAKSEQAPPTRGGAESGRTRIGSESVSTPVGAGSANGSNSGGAAP